LVNLLPRAKEERLARANGRAHGLLADARSVVAHVALHHELPVFVHLRHAKRTRQNAIPAGDAARLARSLHDSIDRALNCIRRADLSAGWLLAMHANDRHRLHTLRALYIFEMNHRLAAVRVAFAACLHARLAADAAVGVDEELEMLGLHASLLLRLQFT